MAIELSNALVRSWIDSAGLAAPAPGKLHILGVRSARRLGPRTLTRVNPTPDKYDDVLILHGVELEVYTASVDPGKYYTERPLHPQGCAHVADGGPYPYALGYHKKHRALVQNGPVKYWRDRDKDGQQDSAENPQWGSDMGINIHAGGISVVGKNSAGCPTVAGGYEGEAWLDFIGFCEAAAPHQDRRFQFRLLDGKRIYPA